MMNKQTSFYLILLLLLVGPVMTNDDAYWCICLAIVPSIVGGFFLIVGLFFLGMCCRRRCAERSARQPTIRQTHQQVTDVESQKMEEPVVVARPGTLPTVQVVKDEGNVIYPVAQTT